MLHDFDMLLGIARHDNSKNKIQDRYSCKFTQVCIAANNMIGYHYDVKRKVNMVYNCLSEFLSLDVLQIKSFLFAGNKYCDIVSNSFELKPI